MQLWIPILALFAAQASPTAAKPAQPAQPAPREAKSRIQTEGRPVEMTSTGGLSIDLKKQTGFAKGDVIIKRDDILVCCDAAEAKYSGNQIERVTCRGRVVIVRPDGTRATADVAVYTAVEDRVTLTGGAHVVTQDTDLKGDKIVYDIARDHVEVEGGKGARSQFKFRQAEAKMGGVLDRPCPPVEPKKQ